jgi:hypothetical protein
MNKKRESEMKSHQIISLKLKISEIEISDNKTNSARVRQEKRKNYKLNITTLNNLKESIYSPLPYIEIGLKILYAF